MKTGSPLDLGPIHQIWLYLHTACASQYFHQTQEVFMRSVWLLVVALSVMVSACQIDQPTEESQPPPREMLPQSDSPYFAFLYSGGKDETWNGKDDETGDCAPPAKDCTVIRPNPPAASDWPYYDFHIAVVSDNFASYYSGATGNDFVILESDYEDSVAAGTWSFECISDTTDSLSSGKYVFKPF